ncbi:MAG: GAF domain-containing protein [Tissierellia bacterium]|mgnify:CR=1 FL=1|nr:GAF domain-containing protein [Tissierellia bacterium]
MFKLDKIKDMTDEERLKYMLVLAKGQLSSEQDELANISNVTGIIMACVDKLNWAGFYFLRGGELVLGPFQGLPACNRIAIGKGVCGTAVATREVQLIPDVHQFPGHIACDAASNSELVIPIIKDDKVYGVLDLDSPVKNRFTELEKDYFVQLVDILNKNINWDNI